MFGANDVYKEIPADKYIADEGALKSALTVISPTVNIHIQYEYNKPGVVYTLNNSDPNTVNAILLAFENALVDLPFSWADEFDFDAPTVIQRMQWQTTVLRNKGYL